MLKANAAEARQADNRSSFINETGKYIGVITRAERLLSRNKATGLGLSFKDDSGATANYLDLYTHNADGKTLPSNSIVNALLVCLRTKEVPDGEIEVERWDKEAKTTYKEMAPGYPSLIGKRIGFLFQRELSDNDNDPSKPNDRVIIYGVFEADTEFTASEILDKSVKPEKVAKMVEYLASHPVNDRRKNKGNQQSNHSQQYSDNNFNDLPDDDLDF
jgi:hypothetical protein